VYFSPGLGSVNEIMDKIREYVAWETQSDPWFRDHPVEVAFLRHKNAAKIDKSEPIVDTVYTSAKTVSGKNPLICGGPYGADMELFANLGKIPTMIFGPGSIAHAHKPNELISIDEYISAVKTLALSIYKWCK